MGKVFGIVRLGIFLYGDHIEKMEEDSWETMRGDTTYVYSRN